MRARAAAGPRYARPEGGDEAAAVPTAVKETSASAEPAATDEPKVTDGPEDEAS